jgi:UPF0716 protein FxsA
MFFYLVILFICIPFIELAILIRLGMEIGFWPTVFIQIVTGVVGASLARWQGFYIWSSIQYEIANGRMPGDRLVDGFLILIAGIVLLTPGLLTDAFGLTLLIPITRNSIKRWLKRKLAIMSQKRDPRMTIIIK